MLCPAHHSGPDGTVQLLTCFWWIPRGVVEFYKRRTSLGLSMSICSRLRGPLFITSLIVPFASPVLALSIDIDCGGMIVGTITMNADPLGAVVGNFMSKAPAFPTLAAAAKQCNEDHFNWYQVVTADNQPPTDAGGNRLTPPYVDPPPGGYLDENAMRPGNQTLIADNLPWYWNEGPNPPVPPGADQAPTLASKTSATTLEYEDAPGNPGSAISFRTWLVSLNSDSSLHGFLRGFEWNISVGATGAPRTIGGPTALPPGDPTNAEFRDITTKFETRVVPEPSTLVLIALGLATMITARVKVSRSSYKPPP